MKTFLKVLAIIVVVLFVLGLAKNLIIKAAVENGVGLVTGLKLNMKSFKLGILDTDIVIKGLRIYNPKNFEEKIMLDMPEITADYHLGDIIGGKIHLEKVVVNLTEFNIVKNKDGELNLDSLKVVKESKEDDAPKKEEAPKEEKPKEKGEMPEIQIDYLQLKVGKVAFKDYSKDPKKPSENAFEINLDETHENITNPQVLVGIIVSKALMKASLAKLSGFDLGGLQGTLTNALGDVSGLAGEALGNAQALAGDALKQAEKLTEVVKVDKLADAGAESLSKVADLGAGGVDKLKGLGSGALGGIKNIGGGATDTVGNVTEDAGAALKGLAGKLKLPGGGDNNDQ